MAKVKKSEEITEEPLASEPQEIKSEMLVEDKHIEKGDSEEVLFLKKLYRVQNDGGFGIHLNQMINERIAEIESN